MNSFEPKQVIESLHAFAGRVPKLLRSSAALLDLADKVGRFDDLDAKPFSVAIVGQMRVGKSTLINALVGDDVTITGVNETTATVNWIRHGSAEEAKQFRVVWDTNPPQTELCDRSDLELWIGNSDRAKRTRYLEFSNPSSFLEKVWIIDTPGARSVHEDHEATLRGLLSEEKSDQDTSFYGGVADCLVYVVPPVARENDAITLRQFGNTSRLQSASPYNCIAVLHKWESLIDHETPWLEAERMATVQYGQLQQFVAEVIPVSGVLYRAVQSLNDSYWDRLVAFLISTAKSDLTRLITGLESRFRTLVIPQSNWSPQDREALLVESKLPWPSFKVIVKWALANPLGTGAALREQVRKISGADRLLQELQTRFFNRARVIRSTQTLQKSLSICEQAAHRLRSNIFQLDEAIASAQEALQEAEICPTSLPKTLTFLKGTLQRYQKDLEETQAILKSVEVESRTIRDCFLSFDEDLKAIRLLDDHPAWFSPGETKEILALLGAFGTSVEERFGHSTTAAILQDKLNHWCVKCEESAGTRQRVLAQVVNRLESAIYFLTERELG